MTTIDEVKQANAEIAKLMDEGKMMEAFEKFYGDDVIMGDNANALTVGKAANREREIAVFAEMETYKSTVLNRVYGTQDGYDVVVVTIMENDFKHKQFGEVKAQQSSVTYWKDGKVVKEHFYYAM